VSSGVFRKRREAHCSRLRHAFGDRGRGRFAHERHQFGIIEGNALLRESEERALSLAVECATISSIASRVRLI